MNKKTKLITRILCAILALIIVLGLVIPAVSADELQTEPTVGQQDETDTKPSKPTESTEPVKEENDGLPDGFYYHTDDYGVVTVQKSKDNLFPAAMFKSVPDNFKIPSITIFVGNMETYEVRYFNLTYSNNYVASLPLTDGYYVLFTNGYAWEAADGTVYTVNKGQHSYLYVGNDYNPELYGEVFKTDVDIMSFTLDTGIDSKKVIKYGNSLLINNDNLQYPYDAKLDQLIVPETPTIDKPTPQEPGGQEQEDDTTKSLGLVGYYFKKMLWESKFVLLILIGCGTALLIIRQKKKKLREEQNENDKYDDHRIE